MDSIKRKNSFNFMSHTNIELMDNFKNYIRFGNTAREEKLVEYEKRLEKLEEEMFADTKCERFYVNLDNQGYLEDDQTSRKIWTLATINIENTDLNETPILLVHGFMSGMGDWKYNVKQLSEENNRQVFAIDLLGFGRSSRFRFSSDPWEAESQLVDSIEEWRVKLGLKKLILIGHSFGGYICSSYSLKYSQNVEMLILEDPWGFDTPHVWDHVKSYFHLFIDFLRVCFAVLICNFLVLPSDSTNKIFNEEKKEHIFQYFYEINALRFPSGISAFESISEFGFFCSSKHPMIARFEQAELENPKIQSIPVCFLIGKSSWINYLNYLEKLRQIKKSSSTSKLFVYVIDEVGHRIHSDKPFEFNEKVKHFINNSNFN